MNWKNYNNKIQSLQFQQVLSRPVFMNIQTAMIVEQTYPHKRKKLPSQKR